MKKIISIFLAGAMFMLLAFPASAIQINEKSTSAASSEYLKGDIDGNGVITPYDALLISRTSFRLEEFPYAQTVAADVNNDWAVNYTDAYLTLDYSIGFTDDIKLDCGIYEDTDTETVYYDFVEKEMYHKGDTVTLQYNLKNAPRVGSLGTNIYFDPDYIKFTLAETDIKADIHINDIKPGVIKIGTLFDPEGKTNDFSSDSRTFITFTFQALKDFTIYDLNIYEKTYELSSISADGNSTELLINIASEEDNHSELNMSIDTTSNKDPELIKKPEEIYTTIGDIDGDGNITSADSLLILRYSVNLEKFDETQKKIADVDDNDFINSADALAVLRHSVGLKSYHIGTTIKKY